MPSAVSNLQDACDTTLDRRITPVPTEPQSAPLFGQFQIKRGAGHLRLCRNRWGSWSQRMYPQQVDESTSTDSCKDGQHRREPPPLGPPESTLSFHSWWR